MTFPETLDSILQSLESLNLSYPCNVLVLAPHPDDFDAIGVTMKGFFDRECKITVAVLTGGANGVETGFEGARSNREKELLRQKEQLASCEFFGLESHSVRFLSLAYNADDSLSINESNTRALKKLIEELTPAIICLPHGNDSNMTHQRVYALYQRSRRYVDASHLALLNRDAKTRSMTHNLVTGFDVGQAQWKRKLLRHHESQEQRNMNTRACSFDDRVLNLNQTIAQELALDAEYAEAFEIEHHRP